MDEARWNTIEALFQRALDASPEERDRLLEDERERDREVVEEVRAMLEVAHAEGLLEIESRFGRASVRADEDRAASSPSDEGRDLAGTRVGAFELMERIGVGGMGVVYRARRIDDFEQTVAVKMVRAVVTGTGAVARFKTERDILARLEHPHIVRLLDGGVFEGSPYFVMELFDGIPITDSCDLRKLSIVDRLRTFRQVCDAVQIAHQNLIVHRDIKPSNILVSSDGIAKLLDFGIAKLLTKGGADAQATTAFHAATPDYAAPEQLRGDPITTETDVYGLGALLYELLSGSRPFGDVASGHLARAVLRTTPPPLAEAARTPGAAAARGLG
ncbi:serine/threonine protein kinase, partial [bacterium]|nr:serine/threonine protein kinase [bacterium]